MRIQITGDGVEIELFDKRGDPTHIITIDPMDTAKAQLLVEILEGATVDVVSCNWN